MCKLLLRGQWSTYLLAAILCLNHGWVSAGELDGKVFVGPIGVEGSTVEEEIDEVTFNNGELYSASCAPWGFKAGSYTTISTSEGLAFKATAMSPNDGKIVWEGVVKGDDIEAVFTWTKERWWWSDARQVKWYKGKLKP